VNVGSLFTGIGGIDLGLERAGMRIAWQCEVDPWCQRVLAKHWPSVPRYGDIRSIDATAERVDVLAGGFPCQSSSYAGKRLGSADQRWLWPEFARLVRLLRPRFVLVENVPGLLAPIRERDTGQVIGPAPVAEVLGDLAACGYDAEWDSIGAVDVGAPHIRKRVWIVAYPRSDGRREGRSGRSDSAGSGERLAEWAFCEVLADPDGARLEGAGRPGLRQSLGRESAGSGGRPQGAALADTEGGTERAGLCEGEPRIFGRRRPGDLDRSRHAWQSEPDVGRVAHGVPARVDRLRGLGNAVVPQVVEWIGRRMMDAAVLDAFDPMATIAGATAGRESSTGGRGVGAGGQA
jgi:DNA (cytosine-5)-methyltransferase 1